MELALLAGEGEGLFGLLTHFLALKFCTESKIRCQWEGACFYPEKLLRMAAKRRGGLSRSSEEGAVLSRSIHHPNGCQQFFAAPETSRNILTNNQVAVHWRPSFCKFHLIMELAGKNQN